MWRSLYLLGLLCLVCGSPPDPGSPEAVMGLLAPCVDHKDAACLFARLDRDSRWAIQTIHKNIVEIRGLANQTYPVERRDEAFGSWRAESEAPTPEALFQGYCARTHCLDALIDGFGAAVATQENGENEVFLTTTKGTRFAMKKDEGKWGLSTLTQALLAEKLRLQDRLAQVKKDAAAFEALRAAGSMDVEAPAANIGEL